MFFEKVFQGLNEAKVDYAVVGGLAVALHGAVRGTVDLDIVVKLTKSQLVAAEKVLSGLGLRSRIPVTATEIFAFREEYIKNRNLIAWSFVNPVRASEVVDIILTHDEAKMKTVTRTLNGIRVGVASIDELIRMKETSGRPQDLEDVRALKGLKS